MSWVIENVEAKPHQQCGYVGVLRPTRPGVYGSIKIEGWLYGCAQNGLFGFNNLSYGATEEDYESLKKVLSNTYSNLGQKDSGWNNKRYLFILTSNQLHSPSPFLAALVKDSKLLDSYENLAHGSAMQHLYRLDL